MTEQSGAVREAHVGDSIRRARLDGGLTLRQVAAGVGVSVGTMSAIENGKVALTVARLHLIAELLGVAPSRLLLAPRDPATEPAPASTAQDWRVFADLPLDPVLGAAIDVFHDTGYHGATMRMIATQADISVAGIYHHHRSKQSLLVALVDLVMSDLTWRVRAAEASGSTSVDRFSRVVEALALFHAVRGDVAFIVATEARSLEEPQRTRIAESRHAVQRLLEDAAVRCADEGTFRTPTLHNTARAVATMCMALPHWYDPRGPQTPAEIATEYAALALAMMHHDPGAVQPD